MNPVSSGYPVSGSPVPFYPVPFSKKLRKVPAPFAVLDADGIPVELYSFAPSIVTAVVKGPRVLRLDVDFISLKGRCLPAFLLGHDSIEVGSDGRAAWLSLYIPALGRGTSPDKLEFGTFSVDTTM